MRLKSGVFVLLLSALPGIPLGSIELYIAPTAILSGSETAADADPRDIERILRHKFEGSRITIKGVRDTHTPPANYLDAALCAARNNAVYLIYGYLRSGGTVWEGELKLFDREQGEVRALFFGSDSRDHYGRLIEDLGDKIVEYFSVDLGLARPPIPRPQQTGIFAFPLHLGVWLPSGDYSSLLHGTGRVETGVLFTPRRPLWVQEEREGAFETGVLFSYSLGLNKSGYESFYLHTLRIALPLRWVLETGAVSAVLVGCTPAIQFDLLSQDRAYSGLYRELNSAPGIGFRLGYRHRINTAWSLEFSTLLEVSAYRGRDVRFVSSVGGIYEFH